MEKTKSYFANLRSSVTSNLFSRRGFLLLALSLAALCAHSQTTLTGSVVSDENDEAVPFANITLFLLPDTSTVSRYAITDLQGAFGVEKMAAGEYLCHVSYVGYATLTDTIRVAPGEAALTRRYRLRADARLIGEVVVTGSKQTASTGKQSYLITELEKKGKANAFEMLGALPNIVIDPLQQSVTSASGGSVKILINGLSNETTDLLALQPDDIVRIEHYEVPPTRYVNYESVINVITRPRTTGWTLSFGLDHALTTGFGNDWLNFSFFKGKHQFALNYSLNYRDYSNRQYDRLYEYDFHDARYLNTRDGRDKFGYDYHDIDFAYIYQTDKTVFRAKFTPIYVGQHSDGNQDISLWRDEELERREAVNWRRSKEFNPVVDLYFQHSFSDKDQLALNLVGTGFATTNKYRNQERETTTDDLRLNEDVVEDNRKYSLIGEAWYSRKWNERHTLNVGYQMETYRMNSKVDNTFGNNKYNTNFMQNYVYAEMVGNAGKWGYILSLGLVRKHTESVTNNYGNWLFRPSLTLQYALAKGQYLRLQFTRQNFEPAISSLSDNKTYVTDEIISTGNPDLRNQLRNHVQLTYGLSVSPWLNFQLRPFFSYTQSPINSYYSYSADENKIVIRSENGTYYQNYGSRYSVTLTPIKGERLTVSLSGNGGAIWQRVKSPTIGTVSYFYAPFYGSVNIVYDKWSLTGFAQLATATLNGSYRSTYENNSRLSLGYNTKKWSARASVYFLGAPSKYHTYSIAESLVRMDTRTRIYDNKSMFTLGFSLFLSKGKTYQTKKAVLENSDTDSGSFY
ncbi:MAG: outer membrane beta-barrel protein [Mediterranea sp.]|jgi:hypothetical protein|nr:outer membrane beta-barrel protein [Mediterranea sp.]